MHLLVGQVLVLLACEHRVFGDGVAGAAHVGVGEGGFAFVDSLIVNLFLCGVDLRAVGAVVLVFVAVVAAVDGVDEQVECIVVVAELCVEVLSVGSREVA